MTRLQRMKSRMSYALLVALASVAAQAQLLREPARGEAVERHLPGDRTFTQWVHDPSLVNTQGGDRFEAQEVAVEDLETVKLTNLVPPIRFAVGVAEIPDATVLELRRILDGVRDRRNVRLHLVGHADNQRLSPALAAVFGDNEGLSRERAGEVAELLKGTLDLPAEAVSYSWAGDQQPVASNETEAGRAQNRRVEVEVWYDEVKHGTALDEVLVEEEFSRIKVCRMEQVCRLRYVDGNERRTRVQNVVAPLRFGDEAVEVTAAYVEQIREAVANLSDRHNVLVKFVGYTDDTPLPERNARIYGDHVGLSRAQARRVALAVQQELGIATSAVDSDGRGAARPLGSNATAQGRALNRRVEVEFWYDDPLQDLPDEPQLCPAPGNELVTRVYDPPWGALPQLAIENGEAVVPAGFTGLLRRGLADVADKTNPRLRFVGFVRNERLERRTTLVYGDDIGLSAARARRAMEAIAADMQLTPAQVEFEGRGYVHSDDVVNAGFIQGETSHIVVQVVYDELAELDDYDGVEITPLTRELAPENAFALNLMRITVDGKPLDDKDRSSADIQRCTDVALEQADIQFGFDNLEADRRLAVAADPATVEFYRGADGWAAEPVRFRMYANYSHFIERAEVRIFAPEQSLEAKPLALVAFGPDGSGEWLPETEILATPARELKYVLRAYGSGGTFDETVPQPLWIAYREIGDAAEQRPGEPPAEQEQEITLDESVLAELTTAGAPYAELPEREAAAVAPPLAATAEVATEIATQDRALRRAYGENALGLRNIPLASGSVTVRGNAIPPGHQVYVAGRQVPVADDGSFIAQEILPSGVHTVEVAVLDGAGNGELYLRDIELEGKDWFYVGMADVTLTDNDSNGPIELLQGENGVAGFDSSADARLAFYLNGKFNERWRLTASADTRDAPLEDLFSNFLDKSPDALFRRIDPDYHFPTFGDDGAVEEMAPTLGKFYVKVGRDESYGEWGNFHVGYMNNELAQVDRGLYGAKLHYESQGATSFGERRFAIDGFTAEPGTVASREEFRGTGGSLYFLQRQDLLAGSERVRIEYRDRASGLVSGVLNLTPGIDYDVDYLQGRLLLTEPLNATRGDDLLVRDGAIQGDEAYLVVRYEYTPGFDEIDALSTGAQGHYWFGERVKLGLTANSNDEGDVDSGLEAADVTVRISSDSWFKLQGAQTEGFISSVLRSDDGGFGFSGYDGVSFAGTEAGGYRADVSLGLGDFMDRARGRLTMYTQSLDAGYSAPGLQTLTDAENYGGTFQLPVTDRLSLRAKSDHRSAELGLTASAHELNVAYELNDNWGVATGVRVDERRDDSPVVALTQEQGARTDAVVQVGYDSNRRWSTYGFLQDTVSVDGGREENARIGTGGSYRIGERLKIDAEVSNGDLGAGGKFGTNYLHNDRTTLYLNYALENERTDNGLLATRGSEGNTVAGVKTRLSDSTSVYLEERYQNAAFSSGLTHSTGISLAPTERLNLGASTDIGTLRDALTGAETERRAAGFRIGYGFSALQLSSGVEFRSDETEQPDLTFNTRETWLLRNNFKWQLSEAARLLGKLNHAESVSSLGQFYDGGYTEAVLGYAFRPVRHDRLNALVKYTYFYNVPTTDQLTQRSIAAEFIQKSHVGALDLTYDLSPRWSIGGKYAHRRGQLSLSRDNPEFFDNTADLFVIRTDFRFKEDWEGLVEARVLEMPDLSDQRSGALVVVSRYLNPHFKVGVGYNFTDFSDDLTDLSFDHRGVFLSLTGAL
jgi:flagellar motor protein MotB